MLYTHHMSAGSKPVGLDEIQGAHTAQFLMESWEKLPAGSAEEIQPILAELCGGDPSARAELERHMETQGPSRAALTVWLWSCWRHPIARTMQPDRQRKLDEARAQLAGSNCSGVWLWGAGDFARSILSQADPLGVPILGVLDDFRHGERLRDFIVAHPDRASIDPRSNQAVFIASDLYAQTIWERSEPLRVRGVVVLAPSTDHAAEPVR